MRWHVRGCFGIHRYFFLALSIPDPSSFTGLAHKSTGCLQTTPCLRIPDVGIALAQKAGSREAFAHARAAPTAAPPQRRDVSGARYCIDRFRGWNSHQS